MKIKIIFMGWNENGEACLSNLMLSKNLFYPDLLDIDLVIVPKSFKTKKMFKICNNNKLNIIESDKNIHNLKEIIHKRKPHLIISASFPWIIPPEVFENADFGTINVHASALPKYRGYHPINWAIIKNEKEIGVTIHYIDKGIDTGDIIKQKIIPISNYDDVNSLRKKLCQLGATLLVRVVREIVKNKNKIKAKKQQEEKATYARKRYPAEGAIIWSNNVREIFNLVRSLKKPYPNAFTYNSKKEKIEFKESFITKRIGMVLGKLKGYYLISAADGVVMLKTDSKLKIGEILK